MRPLRCSRLCLLLAVLTLAGAPASAQLPLAAGVLRPVVDDEASLRGMAAPWWWAGAEPAGAGTRDSFTRATRLASIPARMAGEERRPSLVKHLVVGLLIGTGIGLAVGIPADLSCHDCIVPATPFTAAIGAAAGLVGGFLVYGLRQPPSQPAGGS
jgi:hypothetical protein